MNHLFTKLTSIVLLLTLFNSCKKDDATPNNNPIITSISPTTGRGGTIITISGSHFYDSVSLNSVTVNGLAAKVLTATATALTVKIPNFARTGTVNVKTKDGTIVGPTFNYFDIILTGQGKGGALVWNLDGDKVLPRGEEGTNLFLQDTTLYVSGALDNSSQYPYYWKNGSGVAQGSAPGYGTSIGVIGSDVYVGGWLGTGVGVSTASYWQNGVVHTLGDKTYSSQAFGGTFSGSDVYFCGHQFLADGGQRATVWKNGVASALSIGTGRTYATASDIELTKSNDVFVSGFGVLVSGNYYPLYWKNGTMVDLTSSTQRGSAEAIHVEGSDIYVSGEVDGDPGGLHAVYWKNGTMVALTSGGTFAQAFDIIVDGTDVYACGYDNDNAVYWKNGTEVKLGDGEFGEAKRMLVVR